MGTKYSITDKFGENPAELLSDKILEHRESFDKPRFVAEIGKKCPGKTYTQRVELLADELRRFLPEDYEKAIEILLKILGPENPRETGMFTNFYWLLPVGKFVEKYGSDHYDLSMYAIGEITKRNTGEYAVRPFIRKYPDKALTRMKEWARSDNFHLRRLSSEGLRPKLPWAPKLDTFIDNPDPVFDILDLLMEDEVKFVKKSVANHLTDWLKVNRKPAAAFIKARRRSKNEHTRWIIKHATRKIEV